MNVDLEISAKTVGLWRSLASRIRFYSEEANIRIDVGEKLLHGKEEVGVLVRVPESAAHRLHDIFVKAGISDLTLAWRYVHNDPAEAKIQEKLYRGGDTSAKPKEPTARALPATPPKSQDEDYGEALKEPGRRATVNNE